MSLSALCWGEVLRFVLHEKEVDAHVGEDGKMFMMSHLQIPGLRGPRLKREFRFRIVAIGYFSTYLSNSLPNVLEPRDHLCPLVECSCM